MTVAVRSFAKINLGLYIGAARADGYHDLRTVYQTIALHDVIRVSVGRGSGIEILCRNKAVSYTHLHSIMQGCCRSSFFTGLRLRCRRSCWCARRRGGSLTGT